MDNTLFSRKGTNLIFNGKVVGVWGSNGMMSGDTFTTDINVIRFAYGLTEGDFFMMGA